MFPATIFNFLCSVVDWFFFLVLDIGNPVVEEIPLGTRFVVGMLQAVAVRSAGFSTVSIASLAAGVKSVQYPMYYFHNPYDGVLECYLLL